MATDLQEEACILPPSMRPMTLTLEDVETIDRLLSDPNVPGHEGKEMETSDASILIRTKLPCSG